MNAPDSARGYFDLVHGRGPRDAFVEIRPFHRKSAKAAPAPIGPPSRAWFENSPEGRELAASHCAELASRGLDVFAGVGLRTQPGGGKIADTCALACLWADVDFKTTLKAAATERLEGLRDAGLRPSLVVKTGGGVHIYFLLEVVDIRDPTRRTTHRGLNQRLARVLGGDLQATDAARILRVPGTYNGKYDPPAPVIAKLLEGAPIYTLEDAATVLGRLAPPHSKPAPKAPSGGDDGRVGEGARHDFLKRNAGRLRRDGLGGEALQAALLDLNARCCEPPLPDLEVEQIAAAAGTWPSGPTLASVEKLDAANTKKRISEILGDDPKVDQILAEAWAAPLYSAQLDPAGVEEVLEFVAKRLGKKRAVNAAWKTYRAARDKREQVASASATVEREAAGRPRVMWDETKYNAITTAVEKAMVGRGLLRLSQTYVRVSEDTLPGASHSDDSGLPAPKLVLTVPYTHSAMTLAVESAVCLAVDTQRGLCTIPVPANLVRLMLDLPDKAAPQLAGLAHHPLITSEGRLIEAEGYDAESGLFVALGGWHFPEVPEHPTRDDAAAATAHLRQLLFTDVLLRDPKADGAALLALYTVGLSRKVLPQAPAGLITAALQGSGKTTVARQLHVVLTGRDMSVQALTENVEEFQKALLATLLRQPEVICYDNIPDGSTVDNAILAGVLTSSSFTGRQLGENRELTVPTNSLFLFTGNGITVGTDLIRRFVQVDLLAREAGPEGRRFTFPDPVRRAQEIRPEVIKALLTIQRAWFEAGCPDMGPSFGLGPEFDRLVLWPLAFAGEVGILEKRRQVAEHSPEEQARVALLHALAHVFGSSPFTVAAVLHRVDPHQRGQLDSHSPEGMLRDAIAQGDTRRLYNSRALGKYFAAIAERPPCEGLALRRLPAHGGVQRYMIEGAEAGLEDGPPRQSATSAPVTAPGPVEWLVE